MNDKKFENRSFGILEKRSQKVQYFCTSSIPSGSLKCSAFSTIFKKGQNVKYKPNKPLKQMKWYLNHVSLDVGKNVGHEIQCHSRVIDAQGKCGDGEISSGFMYLY